MGYIKKEFLDYAESGKVRKFDPFIESLQKYQETELKWGVEDADDLASTKPNKRKDKVE